MSTGGPLLKPIIALFMLLSAVPCAFAASAGGQTTLKIGTPTGLPGFAVTPEGKFQATDPVKQRLTDCVAKQMKVKFEWIAVPTIRAITMLTKNEVDMAYPMGFTSERAATLLPSRSAWENPDYYVSMQAIDMDNKDVRIAARLGSPQHTDYVSDGFTKFTPAYTYEELAQLLERGAIDVAIVNRSIYGDMKSLWPAGHTSKVGRARNSGFYLNKDDPKHLHGKLNASISACVEPQPLK